MLTTTAFTTATVATDTVRASVSLEGRNSEERQLWSYVVTYGSEFSLGVADLLTGVGATETPTAMLRTLAGFLAAHAESSEGGENADLFAISREASEAISEAIYLAVGWED